MRLIRRTAAPVGAAVLAGLLLTGCGAEDRAEPKASEESVNDAVETVREYLTAFVDGRPADACALETPEFSRAQVREAVENGLVDDGATCTGLLAATLATVQGMGADLESLRSNTIEVTSSTAERATVRVEYPDAGNARPETFELVLTDGRWLIDANADEDAAD